MSVSFCDRRESFRATVGSACGYDPKKQKDCIFSQNIGFMLGFIHIYKILIMIYALFATFCGGKKLKKKITFMTIYDKI